LQLWQIEPVPVIGYDPVGLGNQSVCRLDHFVMPVSPFREEVHLALVQPLGTEAKRSPRSYKLIESNRYVKELPYIGNGGTGFDVEDQYPRLGFTLHMEGPPASLLTGTMEYVTQCAGCGSTEGRANQWTENPTGVGW
jgi:hypothetical protein